MDLLVYVLQRIQGCFDLSKSNIGSEVQRKTGREKLAWFPPRKLDNWAVWVLKKKLQRYTWRGTHGEVHMSSKEITNCLNELLERTQ